MKKFMKKVKENEKISILGTIDSKKIEIKNKSFCKIVECFYSELNKEHIDINKIKTSTVTNITIQGERIDINKSFALYGYARRKGNADENSMRYYFSLEFSKIENLFFELTTLKNEYLNYNNVNDKDFKIIVEDFYIEKETKGKN